MANNNNTTERSLSVRTCEDLQLCLLYEESSFYLDVVVVILTALDILLIIATILSNGIFIVSLFRFENLRRSSNYLLLNLAVVNSMFGTLSFSICGVFQLQFIDCQPDMCLYQDLFVFLAGTGLSLGLSSFTLISIERYLCIFYALRWQRILTNAHVAVVVCSVWIVLVPTFSLLYSFNLWAAFYNFYIITLLINVLALVIINGKILKEIRRHENRIALDTQGVANVEESRKAREKKRAKTIIWMLALLFLCYGPTVILALATKIPSIDQVRLQFGWMACRTISLSHSAFAILVYGLRTKEIRSAYKSLLKKLCGYGRLDEG